MLGKIRAFRTGLHFRFLLLVSGLAVALLAAQLVTDTANEIRKVNQRQIADALSITAVMARSLEKQFDRFELSDIEEILSSVRSRPGVLQLSVVDRDLTFYLDGDPRTSPIASFNNSDVQLRALKSSKTEHKVSDKGIEVGEPLLSNGTAIGSVYIRFRNPGFLETVLPIIGSKLMTMVPILIAGLLFSAGLVSQITLPLRRLSVAAMAFSAGDLNLKIKIEGAREIRQLGEAFSSMIEKLKANIEQIYELAYVDRITQLPNREFFKGEVIRAIKRAERQGSSGALLFVDLDGFKRVNDTMGHEVGDRLLKMFSERVVNVVRANDMVAFGASREYALRGASTDKQIFARLGGDEFTVLLEDIHEETDAASVARRIIAATSEAFVIDGAEVNLGASIGIATYPHDGSDYHSILKSADMAMYQAKEEGKNTYRFYSDELNKHAARRLEVESDLRRALAREELELYFQPIVDCNGGAPVAAEALVRWNHPVKGVLDPGEFIRIAEKSGLVLPLGLWVLKAACERMKELSEAGFDLSITINISRNQFEQHDFAQRVLETISGCGTSARRIELEISEEVLVANQRRTMEHFRRLKRSGIRIAVDDFGTGHSNLAQLGRLRPDVVKIDRSFVELLQDAADDQGRRTTRAILALAKSLEYSTCAVGVETGAQLKFLRDAGCDRVQGYLFGPAMPLGDFLQWLSSHGQDEDQLGDGPRKVAAG
ncbi:MAG: EAL domain-containing protein [Nitratireductor sp.]|nr:EAL domain-containing protein [Nitratireductor sp.]